MKHLLLIICLVIHSYHSSAIRMLRRNDSVQPPTENKKILLNSFKLFDQKLDHFNPHGNTTWKQRYTVNRIFFKHGTESPVFIMISGEDSASNGNHVGEAWINYAHKYGALCFLLEHRYYGKSHPTPDFTTKKLKYLSSEQALADLAYFIEGMNKKYGLTSSNKWIAFGGSYAGSLAAWLRLKYPHLVHGAVSSSGVFLAKADFVGYFDVAKSSLDTYKKGCSKTLNDASSKLQAMMKRPHAVLEISKYLKPCTELDVHNGKEVTMYFEGLSDIIGVAVQYNDYDDPIIEDICEILTNKTVGNSLDRLAKLIHDMYGCVEVNYSDKVSKLRSGKDMSERLWFYQTCTEFGFYQTSEKRNSLFGTTINVKYFKGICTDVFGPEFNATQLNKGIHQTNRYYGGLDIVKHVTRVVFVHGSIDPWHALGVTKSSNPKALAIFINGTSHCADMSSNEPDDPPQLKHARAEIHKLIGQWLKE